jgi:predicted amidohydrolase
LTSINDVTENVSQILKILATLPTTDLDLICLPENSLFFKLAKNESIPSLPLDHPQIERLQKFVDERDVGLMLGSIPNGPNDRPYNSTVFLRPKQKPEILYRKIHLFDVDVPGAPPVRESESFEHGPKPSVVEWRGWKIGLSICYDLRFPELYEQYAKIPVDLILIPSAFLVPTGQAHWDILVRARAIESQCYVVAAAQGGEHVSARGEKRHTYGHSMIVEPWGGKLVEIVDDKRWAVARLEKSVIERTRSRIPMREHRKNRAWKDEGL